MANVAEVEVASRCHCREVEVQGEEAAPQKTSTNVSAYVSQPGTCRLGYRALAATIPRPLAGCTYPCQPGCTSTAPVSLNVPTMLCVARGPDSTRPCCIFSPLVHLSRPVLSVHTLSLLSIPFPATI
jgi:hypothetical protein